jgi:HAD superfamily hydrolase (TIGR01490 family)
MAQNSRVAWCDMPASQPDSASARPIVAFFDVDNTLLHGASAYHVSRAAWKRGHVGVRDLLSFGWHQLRFVTVGENVKHFASAQERALGLAKGLPADELTTLADDVYEREIESRLWPETVELAREHLRKGHEVWLITAAPVDIAAVIARRLGLTGALGTMLRARDGKLTGEFDGPVLHGARKGLFGFPQRHPPARAGGQPHSREPGCRARRARANSRLADHAARPREHPGGSATGSPRGPCRARGKHKAPSRIGLALGSRAAHGARPLTRRYFLLRRW